MKKFKKVFAVILSLAMILGMSLTTFAATPSSDDEAELTITNLKGGETVKLYRIANAKYGEGSQKGFLEYVWNDGVEFADKDKPTADELNALAKKITTVGTLVDEATKTLGAGEKVYSYTATAGAYLAIITAGDNSTVYNPIILSAAYGKPGAEAGSLSGSEIDAKDAYLYGTTAVAKSTDITFSKGMEGYTPDADEQGTAKPTASVGQVLTYTLNAKVPSYPANAENKTFFMSDTMVTGLTFDYASLVVKYNGQTISKNENSEFIYDNKVIAKAVETKTGDIVTGFNINFDYDKLVSNEATGELYDDDMSVEYKAVINSTAVVGQTGNENNAELYYAKNPNTGSTWKTPDSKPETDEASGNDRKTDQKIVYTYQLLFEKADSENQAKLENARFGIYTDEACTNLIDEVITDAQGRAVSTNVGKGTYYIKELQAPDGYSLESTVYKVVAEWKNATETIVEEVSERQYTTTKPSEDALQIGWIENSVFYNLNAKPSDDAAPAYVVSETKKTTYSSTEKSNETAGTVNKITLTDDTAVGAIPNTKLASLPSTGGIGTTIFTIGGCAIMIIAAALFFASRRKSAK